MWSFFSRDSTKDFNYEIGEAIDGFNEKSIWSLHKGKCKKTNEIVSILVYDIKSGSETKLDIARSSLKRLKTLRHPSILNYLDSFENDKFIYVAIESVTPLGNFLHELQGAQREIYLAWGIFQITVSIPARNPKIRSTTNSKTRKI
jgi:SCY1-like protein 1